MTDINTSGDSPSLLTSENKTSSNILNTITQTDTPIQEYMLGTSTDGQRDNMLNRLDFRPFTSIDVDGSNSFYKIVQSNPNDTIDKSVLFNGNVANWGTGQNNFDINDFNPLQNTADLEHAFDDVIGSQTIIQKALH
jgi:hypothetical protein